LNKVQQKTRPGLAASVMIGFIRAYQLTLSALFGRTCRHLPTCSSYTMEAIARHGAWAGFWLGLFRIARCNPWGSSGYDPVPDDVPRAQARFWRYASLRGKAQDNK
jgi:putative membrane protein insertion efficiency factor